MRTRNSISVESKQSQAMAENSHDVEIQDRFYGKELIRIVQVEKNGEDGKECRSR